MITLPWQAGPDHDAGLALVSVLRLRHRSDVPAFLKSALDLRRAFAQAPGAISLGLAAAPWARTFWTCSLWTDQPAMAAYTAGPLHRHVMSQYSGRMASSRFQTWPPPAERPSWAEVRHRLAEPGAAAPHVQS